MKRLMSHALAKRSIHGFFRAIVLQDHWHRALDHDLRGVGEIPVVGIGEVGEGDQGGRYRTRVGISRQDAKAAKKNNNETADKRG